MIASKKFLVIFLLTSTLFHQPVNNHVIVQIEPEDVQRFADILMQIHGGDIGIHPQQLVIQSRTTKSVCSLLMIRKISQSVIQLVGIMLTLVGANLLTTKLESHAVVQPQMTMENITGPKKLQLKLCQHEYGCDQNMCWRTCGGTTEQEEVEKQSWCYTKSSSKKDEYQMCNLSTECSPCFECLGPCKSSLKFGGTK